MSPPSFPLLLSAAAASGVGRVDVLKKNNYSMEGGEPSVFESEYGSKDALKSRRSAGREHNPFVFVPQVAGARTTTEERRREREWVGGSEGGWRGYKVCGMEGVEDLFSDAQGLVTTEIRQSTLI